jgi:tetratricopeptide (TPR) repeat protein
MFRQGVLIAFIIASLSQVVLAEGNNTSEISQLFKQADSLAEQGQLNQAIDIYEALIKQHPQLPEAYNNLAALYLKQNKSKQAKSVLEQGLHAHKGYGALYESLTAINVAMARDAYSKALQIDLKPSEVAIETLALNDEPPRQSKNTIDIAKAEPAENNQPQSNKEAPVAVVVSEPEQPAPPVVSSEIKPAPVINVSPQVTVTKETVINDPVETVIQAWAAAWSAQAVDIYLSFYHDQFRDANGMSRKNWEQSRRIRVKRPEWIKVTISDYKVERSDSKQAVVTFKQHYESNGYADVGTKRMVLLYTNSGWQIFQETSI